MRNISCAYWRGVGFGWFYPFRHEIIGHCHRLEWPHVLIEMLDFAFMHPVPIVGRVEVPRLGPAHIDVDGLNGNHVNKPTNGDHREPSVSCLIRQEVPLVHRPCKADNAVDRHVRASVWRPDELLAFGDDALDRLGLLAADRFEFVVHGDERTA